MKLVLQLILLVGFLTFSVSCSQQEEVLPSENMSAGDPRPNENMDMSAGDPRPNENMDMSAGDPRPNENY